MDSGLKYGINVTKKLGAAEPVNLCRQARTEVKGAQIESKSMCLASFDRFAECSYLQLFFSEVPRKRLLEPM